MNWAQAADGLQVAQSVGVLILLLIAIGSWRQKQEAAPEVLAAQLQSCRASCHARLDSIEREADKTRAQLDRDYPRKETLEAKLDGMDTRLRNIERALRVNQMESEA